MFSLRQCPLVLLFPCFLEQDSHHQSAPQQPRIKPMQEEPWVACKFPRGATGSASCRGEAWLGFHLVARRVPVIATVSEMSTSMATSACTTIQGQCQCTASAWAAALTAARKGTQVHQFSPVSPWWVASGKRQLRVICIFCLLRFVRGCLERCNQGTLLLPLLHGSLAFMRHLCRDALCSTVIFSGNSAGWPPYIFPKQQWLLC